MSAQRVEAVERALSILEALGELREREAVGALAEGLEDRQRALDRLDALRGHRRSPWRNNRTIFLLIERSLSRVESRSVQRHDSGRKSNVSNDF